MSAGALGRVYRAAHLALLGAILLLLGAIYAKLPAPAPTFGEWRESANRPAVLERLPLVRVQAVSDPVTVDEVERPVHLDGPVEVEEPVAVTVER